MLGKISALLDVRPDEGRPVALLFLYSFFMGSALVLVYTGANALFLDEFGVGLLPYEYVVAAMLIVLTGALYSRLEERLSFQTLLAGTIGAIFVTAAAFWVGLISQQAPWLIFALLVWVDLIWIFAGLVFSILLARLFTVRQGKRLFGLIGAGAVAARIVAYFSVSLIVGAIGAPNLLLVSAACMGISLALLILVLGKSTPQLAAEEEESGEEETNWSLRSLLRDRYVVLIFAVALAAVLINYLIDFGFFAEAEARFENADQLAGFMGLFFGTAFVASLLTKVFLSGRLLNRFGLRIGLLVLPATLALAVSSVIAAYMLLGAVGLIFWLVAFLKFFDEVLRSVIYEPSFQLLYQPFPVGQRSVTQAAAESIVAPLGIGLTGVLLLVFGRFGAFNVLLVGGLILLIALGWSVASLLAYRRYVGALSNALSRRMLEGTSLRLDDVASQKIIEAKLSSPMAGEVIYALDLLEKAMPGDVGAYLVSLLSHPDPGVRCDVLTRIERLGVSAALPAVRQMLGSDTNEQIRGPALMALATLGGPEIIEQILPFVDDANPGVRRGAMVGLLRSGGIEGVLAAGQKLLHMVEDPDPDERILAAYVLGDVGIRTFYQPLLPLLYDAHVETRRAALDVAGRLKSAKLWPVVIDGLGAPQVRHAALQALVAGDESALPELGAALARSGHDPSVEIRLVLACGRIGGQQASALLKERINSPNELIRTQVLRSLSRCGYRASSEEAGQIKRQILAEIAGAVWVLAVMADLDPEAALPLLREALSVKLEQYRTRVFYWLSFIVDSQSILRARHSLMQPLASKRAYALEVIDVLAPEEIKAVLLPLLEDLGLEARLQRLQGFFSQMQRTDEERLLEIIGGSDQRLTPWLKASALYSMGSLTIPPVSEVTSLAVYAQEPLVRETAIWALKQLQKAGSSQELERHFSRLEHDEPRRVARLRRLIRADQEDSMPILTTIEKVIILKTVNIFSETPNEILAELASFLDEIRLKAGDLLFAKDDAGDSLYIIVSGKVRVHDGDRLLNYLGEREVFGEMAALDPQPRSASISAAEDTLLLRLEQAPLFELIDDRSEVARGIIQVLSRRVRARVQDVRQLRQRVEELEQARPS